MHFWLPARVLELNPENYFLRGCLTSIFLKYVLQGKIKRRHSAVNCYILAKNAEYVTFTNRTAKK